MEYEKKRDGYGFLIKWLIGLGDIIVINSFFVLLFHFIRQEYTDYTLIADNKAGIAILLINLAYFITASIIPNRLFSNIIFFDKIIQHSLSFISLYYIILSAGLSLFGLSAESVPLWFACYIGLSILYLLWHILIRCLLKLYRSKGYNYKRVVIVGNLDSAANIYNEIKSGDYGYKVLGVFSDIRVAGNTTLPYLGSLNQIEGYCIENKVDEIFCTLQSNLEPEIIKLVNFAERNMIRFFLVPEFYGYIRRKLILNFLQSTPVITIRPEPLQHVYNRALKRIFDILFSLLILLTVFPIVFVVFSLCIKLTSPGPVFFKQKRTGLQGKPFTCYKFRSMRLNDEADSRVTTEGDNRITPIGAFMRRTSIDELPQFFNVLIGNMSVVGPRPHMVKQTNLYNKLIDRFMIRHIIKPGITGWAQISGYRGETATIEQMEGRLRRDVWYIENWSFVLDIKIIVVTIFLLLKGDDQAY
jgi:putative colanic acid biosynthesis UDP-glucose lipid carrier transferase